MVGGGRRRFYGRVVVGFFVGGGGRVRVNRCSFRRFFGIGSVDFFLFRWKFRGGNMVFLNGL